MQDFYIPDKGYDKVTFVMPSKTNKKTGITRTIHYQKISQGYRIMDATFFDGQPTSIQANTIIFQNNEVRIIRNVYTDIFVTNEQRTFSPPLLALKMPPIGKTVSWVYNAISGDNYNCVATWSSQKVEEDKVQDVPVIKFLQTGSGTFEQEYKECK